MSWVVHLTKINNSTYIAEVVDRRVDPITTVAAIIALVALICLTIYVVRKDYNFKRERLETMKRFVSVLEKLEKKLEK